jgi:copper(I)-binding protein
MPMRPVLACLVAAFPLAPALAADPSPGLELSRAWTPAVTKTGTDTPLYLTIANRASEPEELLRVRCPVAHFSEKRTTDKGEGAPSAREVKAIPIPPNETVTLTPGGSYVMLLETTQILKQGETFSCSLAFRKAGSRQIEVAVAAEGARSAP